MEKVLDSLKSKQHLERERGILSLKKYLINKKDENGDDLNPILITEEVIKGFFSNDRFLNEWEILHGGFRACSVLLEHLIDNKIEITIHIRDSVINSIKKGLFHNEVRVRNSCAEILEPLSKLTISDDHECFCWVVLRETLLSSIEDNFEREEGSERPKHDTEGWRALETSFKAIQCITKGAGRSFPHHITEERISEGSSTVKYNLIGLLGRASKHTNRFVREIGCFTCSSLAEISTPEELAFGTELGDGLASFIASGLADNWSQVRFAASVACRAFMLKTTLNETKHPELELLQRNLFFRLFIPRMCLNRYYGAEGVKLFSQETWRLVVGTNGLSLISLLMSDVVSFYISQAKADNHIVRESSCHVIAELSLKLPPDRVRPFVLPLMEALLDAFGDESWPVRDSACLSTARLVSRFPTETKCFLEPADNNADNKDLWSLWLNHTCDVISSVREDTSVALFDVMVALGSPAREKVLRHLQLSLGKVKEQPSDAGQDTSGSEGISALARFGVTKTSKITRDNDPAVHTGQTQYSCGSLAPKLKRGGVSGCGCSGSSGGWMRGDPWEISDGSVRLLRSLAQAEAEAIESGEDNVNCVAVDFLPLLSEIAFLPGHFMRYFDLLETVWKELPLIAAALARTRPQVPKTETNKLIFGLFSDPLKRSLGTDTTESSHIENARVIAASTDCVEAFGWKDRFDQN